MDDEAGLQPGRLPRARGWPARPRSRRLGSGRLLPAGDGNSEPLSHPTASPLRPRRRSPRAGSGARCSCSIRLWAGGGGPSTRIRRLLDQRQSPPSPPARPPGPSPIVPTFGLRHSRVHRGPPGRPLQPSEDLEGLRRAATSFGSRPLRGSSHRRRRLGRLHARQPAQRGPFPSPSGIAHARLAIRNVFRRGLVASRTRFEWHDDVPVVPVSVLLAVLREHPGGRFWAYEEGEESGQSFPGIGPAGT